MDELLALLGQNWRLVFVYPGGLSTLGTLLVFGAISGRLDRTATATPVRDVAIAALWLVTIALLPLPRTGWPYSLDLVALLLLIEVPYWLRLLDRSNGSDQPIDRVATLLNSYPLLLLAIATLGQTTGSLVLREINRSDAPLRWIGIGVWSLVLPPLLALGPWRDEQPRDLIGAVRGVAHGSLLLTAALPTNDTTPMLASFVAAIALFMPLALLDRWWHGDGHRWIRWQPWLCAALLAFVVWQSGQALIARLG